MIGFVNWGHRHRGCYSHIKAHQSSADVTQIPKGARPHSGKMRRNKTRDRHGKWKTMKSSHILPFNNNYANTRVGELLESCDGQVDGVRIVTGRALIRDGDDDAVAIGDVDDLHSLPTQILIKNSRIHGSNKITILVYLATSTSIVVLEEESGLATEMPITTTTASICGGRAWRRSRSGLRRRVLDKFVQFRRGCRVHSRRRRRLIRFTRGSWCIMFRRRRRIWGRMKDR